MVDFLALGIIMIIVGILAYFVDDRYIASHILMSCDISNYNKKVSSATHNSCKKTCRFCGCIMVGLGIISLLIYILGRL